MINSDIIAWHRSAWERVVRGRDTFPHALLIRGRAGLGKTEFAREIARSLLCEQSKGQSVACGACAACGWFQQGNHPDFRLVEPEALRAQAVEEGAAAATKSAEGASRQIRIEQIRELQDFLAIGTHRGGARVVLIRPAEAMNLPTANALLKSLEEPPPATIFLLVSSQPHRLLPTIRSRCHAIDLAPPDRDSAIAWLEEQGADEPARALAYAGNSPLDALEQAASAPARERFLGAIADTAGRDAVALADSCQVDHPELAVAWLQKWVYDLVMARQGLPPRYHPAHATSLRNKSASMRLDRLLQFHRTLCRARSVANHPLNARLFLEELLLGYRALDEVSHGK